MLEKKLRSAAKKARIKKKLYLHLFYSFYYLGFKLSIKEYYL